MADLKAITHSMYDGFNARDYDGVEAVLHDDFKEHETIPGMPSDKSAPRAFMEMFTQSFPDLTMRVEDVLQDGDKVAVRARITGTHEGEFMGMPATGNSFDVGVFDFLEFRDGKCIAHWGTMDSATMMEQLGLGG